MTGGLSYRTRRRLKRLVPLALILLLVGAGIGALYLLQGDNTPEEVGAACVLVIDRSLSTNDASTIDKYQRLAGETIDGCRQERAVLAVYTVEPDTSGIQQQIPALGSRDPGVTLALAGDTNKNRARRELDDKVDELKKQVESLIDGVREGNPGSDLVTGYHEAATAAQTLTDANRTKINRRYLVMLTDGIQRTGSVDMQAMDTPDSDVQALVDQVESLGLVPNLDGISVNFVGIRSGRNAAGRPLEGYFLANQEKFWSAVSEAGGGSACYVDSPPILPIKNCG